VLTILAYLPALDGGFFSDDFVYIVGNEALQLPIEESWRFFRQRTNPFEFLPIRDLSYRLDLAAFGSDAWGYHVHNLLLYALTCMAVWGCVRSLVDFFHRYGNRGDIGRHRDWIACAATTLFAVHPAHVESVAWISGRKEILSGLFCVLSLHLYASALSGERISRGRLGAASLLFLFALLSKATVMPVAFAAVILAVVRNRSLGLASMLDWARGLLPALPMLALAAGSFVLSVSTGSDTGIMATSTDILLSSRESPPLLASRILGYMLGIAIFPANPHLTHDVFPGGISALVAISAGLLACIASAVSVISLWRHRSVVAFGFLLFVLLCLPYLQLVPFRTWSLVSERFLFLALLGLTLATAAILAKMPRAAALALLLVAAGAGLTVTYAQSRVWADRDALLLSNARRAPGNYVAQLHAINKVLLRDHRFAEAEQMTQTVTDPLRAEELRQFVRGVAAASTADWQLATQHADRLASIVGTTGSAAPMYFLAGVYERTSRYTEAARFYYAVAKSYQHRDRRAARAGLDRIRRRYSDRLAALERDVRARPRDLAPAGTLANLEMELYLLDQARDRFLDLIDSHPGDPAVHYNLGLTYERLGEPCLATNEFTKAVELGMNLADTWNNLGLAAWHCDDQASAAEAFQRALDLDPRHWHAAVNLGRMLRVQRDTERALLPFMEAKRRVESHGASADLVDTYLDSLAKQRFSSLSAWFD
jgi:tetratricopeptide (TPR) repeat protein